MTFAAFVKSIFDFFETSVIPILFVLALIAVLVGVVRYFFMPGEENLQKGRQFLLWGGIAFILMFTVWGFVNVLLTVFSRV